MRMQNANIAKKESEGRKVWPRGLRRPNLGLTSPGCFLASAAILLFIFLSALPVSAQIVPTSTELINPSGINTFGQLWSTIVQWLTAIMVPILTIVIIIGGFQMFTARDNEEQFTKGKKTVTYAVIGAAIVLVANGIILVIQSFLNVN
ncbi:hypothetical protein A2755_03230 [Candidatus Wolfebacteria bacterium RIFCSPHIGHO2_01_FULL_48_22]|uniref:Uncharacterized protein n=2 Tax=Candidatus Wolfeibacteriota TaxID=1752735 RepID=A0A1F8DPI4_9BACT|nr:MAG: hypothetical protein A2755_03230 [Candidatus Wolfebacteria bacterium RIFCSPHIGHO2_01_FULL_48_22]OGM92042.1 MAG: hypothetical protein A2935_01720 [Candidatus Wolfebacteria bacterium RIFCSPLOWO2_01_FULL_47_17b]